jgi:hypothetical protein
MNAGCSGLSIVQKISLMILYTRPDRAMFPLVFETKPAATT